MPVVAKSKPALEVREAVAAAQRYCQNLFPKSRITLEEVEVSDQEDHWLITLGVHDPQVALSNHVLKNHPFAQRPLNKLKIFKVDAMTGRVVSMKIR